MNKIECKVLIYPTDRRSNIVSEEGTISFAGSEHQTSGQTKMKIAFADSRGNELATSIQGDGFPDIGMDFLWTYVQKNGRIDSVCLFEDESDLASRKIRLKRNGEAMVAPLDEKVYTERDVVDMLCYAIAHSGITAKEMREKVEETLKWFKQ